MLRRFTVLLVALASVLAACSSGGTDSSSDAEQSTEPDPSAAPATDEAAEQPSEDGDATTTPEGEFIPSEAIVIGAVIDKTGLMKPLDEPALEAARLQVARLNETGGVLGRPLVIDEFDTRSQLNQSFQAAQELIDDGADLLLVTCDFEFARPAIQVAAEAGVLVLSPCGGTAEWGDPAVAGPNVFSLAMPSEDEGRLLAEFVLDRYGELVTMIVDTTDPDAIAQCTAFEEDFRAGGGRFRGRLEVDRETAPELQENVAALTRSSLALPDAVVLCASPLVGADVVLFLRRAGLEVPIVAGSTMDGDDWIVEVERTGEMAVLSYASVQGDDPDPAVIQLFEEYEVLLGEPPVQGRPVTGADAVEAFAVAAERAGSLDAVALAAELEKFDGEELVAGMITYTAESHISARAMRVMEIVDDEPRFAEIIRPAP